MAWNDAAIIATVPGDVLTGPLVVTVHGHSSNTTTFTAVNDTDSTTGGPNPLTVLATTSVVPNAAGLVWLKCDRDVHVCG